MPLKETIENNPVIWTLGTLLAGFLAGLGAYRGNLEMSGLKAVSAETIILGKDQVAVSSEDLKALKQAKAERDELAKSEPRNKLRENFYQVFLRYLVFKDDAYHNAETKEKHKQQLCDLVAKAYQPILTDEADAHLESKIYVTKAGDFDYGWIKVPGDRTEWLIPREISKAVHFKKSK